MRVLMLQPAASQQLAGLDQRLDHGIVGVALLALVVDHALSREAGGMVGEGAVLVDGVGDGGIDAALVELARVRHPHVEVFTAMTGRGMNEAGTGVLGNVVAGQQRHGELISAVEATQWMGTLHRIERIGRNIAHLFVGGDA
jgi:hypothetical protein